MSIATGFSANQPLTAEGVHSTKRTHLAGRLQSASCVALVLSTLTIVGVGGTVRWNLARDLSWQCDEIPLLVRFTGLCGHVTNAREAAEFKPSFYTFRKGAVRSLRAPKFHCSLHTTTHFWTNLSVHLFGMSPLGGRAGPLLWSMVAIAAAAWGAWMVTRSLLASALSVWMVALSPHAAAYGAQARGYAEAMALAPLLLVALEYFRRRPDRWIRGALVLLCAFQLSLTVYTLWVYWTLPVILLSWILIPRHIESDSARGIGRATLAVIAVALVMCMTVYTIDRWSQFTSTASQMGISFDRPGAVRAFLAKLAVELPAAPSWLALGALVGIVVVWKSSLRWWLWMIAAGVIVPLVFAMFNGSAGYVRNFGYLVVPMAILFGVGTERLVRRLFQYIPARPAWIPGGLLIVGITMWSVVGLERRAHAILLPDWGEVVQAVDREPETVGPRWFCHCYANHWQINWYRSATNHQAFLDVPTGGSIEVILGAEAHADRPATLFRENVSRGLLVEEPVPAYIAKTFPDEVRSGVEVHRWRGTRRAVNSFEGLHSDAPVFVLADVDQPPSLWKQFLQSTQAYERGVVTFKYVPGRRGVIRSLIAPAAALSDVIASMQRDLKLTTDDIHCFALTSLTPKTSTK